MYNFSMRDSPERTNNFILENRLLYFPCIIITISTNPSVNLTRQRQYTTFLHTRMYKMYIDIIMTMTTFLAILSVYILIYGQKNSKPIFVVCWYYYYHPKVSQLCKWKFVNLWSAVCSHATFFFLLALLLNTLHFTHKPLRSDTISSSSARFIGMIWHVHVIRVSGRWW